MFENFDWFVAQRDGERDRVVDHRNSRLNL